MKAKLGGLIKLARSAVGRIIRDEDGVTVVEIILVLVGIHTTPQPIVLC